MFIDTANYLTSTANVSKHQFTAKTSVANERALDQVGAQGKDREKMPANKLLSCVFFSKKLPLTSSSIWSTPSSYACGSFCCDIRATTFACKSSNNARMNTPARGLSPHKR